jgi:hypothetical protein
VKKIYVASSWRNEVYPSVVTRLRSEGAEVYDFRNPVQGNHGFSWRDVDPDWKQWTAAQYKAALEHPIAQKGFAYDWRALTGADATVLVAPCGFSAALELGTAIGAGQKTYVLLQGGMREPELMILGANHIVLTLEDLVMQMGRDGLFDRVGAGATR